ncbi:MAG: hypothetical protein ACLP7Q_16580 [Isosphaeraceae bacterium]
MKGTRNLAFVVCRLSNLVLLAVAAAGPGGVNQVQKRRPSFWFNLFRGEDFRLVDRLRPTIRE